VKALPKRLRISIGGHFGPSYKVTLKNGRLTYTYWRPRESCSQETEPQRDEIQPSAKHVWHADLESFDVTAYTAALNSARQKGIRIWNAAYVQNQNYATHLPTKHERYLKLVDDMMSTHLTDKLQAAMTYEEAFQVLQAYPLHGQNFLAMQHLILTIPRSSTSTKTPLLCPVRAHQMACRSVST
jgi:hypothetical protein